MAGLPVIRPFQAGVPGGPGRPTRSQLHPRVSAATAAASGDACARPAAARPRPCQTAPNGCLDFAGAPSGAGQAGRCAAAGRDAGTRKGTTPVRNLARASSRPPCPPAPARPPRAWAVCPPMPPHRLPGRSGREAALYPATLPRPPCGVFAGGGKIL